MNLIETIRVENFKPSHIDYHNKRFNESRKALFGVTNRIDLSSFISPPDDNLFRCRIVYAQDILKVEYFRYMPKVIKHIGIVKSDIEYAFKYENREALNELLEKYPQVDELIIEKNGYLSDTTIANIAFLEKNHWITPKQPLLNGTVRQRLLDEKFLYTKDIKSEDIHHFSGISLMNAMIEFLPLNNIEIINLN